MKKYLLLLIAIIVLGGGSYVTERAFLTSSVSVSSPVATTVAATTTQNATQPARQAPVQKAASVPAQTVATTSPATPAPNVTITVASTSYGVYVPPGSTVLDAMNALASTGNFAFTSKDFPGMGAFVESMNGEGGEGGYSWIFYVNGTESQEGASSVTLSPGDSVEWKYEKSY